MDQTLNHMLITLGRYINLPSEDLPKPGISIVSLTQRPLAIGNRLGVERRGSFSMVETKGGRMDAIVRFHLWGSSPDKVDREVEMLLGRLLAAKDDLRTDGFLRLSLEGVPPCEEISSQNAWRKYADYKVLYEYYYHDTDEAESLINRILIDIDGHLTIISDDMVRWDSQSAPMLEVRRESGSLTRIGAISLLAYLPADWDGLAVTLSASFGGVKHERSFASLREFCGAFDLEKDNGNIKTAELGGKSYFFGHLAFPNADFPNPMEFQRNDDTFCISYAAPSLDGEAVLYIRLLSRV